VVKPNGKRLLLLVLVACACTAGGGGLWWKYGHVGATEDPPPATAQVTRRNLASTVLATGAVKPRMGAEVRVGARISGKVEHLNANIGDVVKKGQTIAEIEKADLQAQVDERTAEHGMAEAKLAAVKSLRPKEVEKAEAEVACCQATLELNRKIVEREDKLLKSGMSPQETIDRAREQLLVSQAKFAVA
jgi:HlyD family secretion protein